MRRSSKLTNDMVQSRSKLEVSTIIAGIAAIVVVGIIGIAFRGLSERIDKYGDITTKILISVNANTMHAAQREKEAEYWKGLIEKNYGAITEFQTIPDANVIHVTWHEREAAYFNGLIDSLSDRVEKNSDIITEILVDVTENKLHVKQEERNK